MNPKTLEIKAVQSEAKLIKPLGFSVTIFNGKYEFYQMDPLGQAILDYHRSGQDLPIRSWIDDEEEPLLYPSSFFRKENAMEAIEKTAMSLCCGKVLDVGAGAGCHSLILQSRGYDLTSLDHSVLSCEVMELRGLKKVICSEAMSFSGDSFDTILLLMNGFGIAQTEEKMPGFLFHLKSLLKPGGSIIGESTDILYMMENNVNALEVDLSRGYYGEVEFKLRYGGTEAKFPWIYPDEYLLEDIASQAGLRFKIIERGERHNFLCKLEV